MDESRRAALERAIENVPGKRTVTGRNVIEVVSKIFALGHEFKPGEATQVVSMLPDNIRDDCMRLAILVEKADEMGKYGHPLLQDLSRRTGLSPQQLDRMTTALNNDRMGKALRKRMGTDADKKLPATTRKDHIEAALQIHNRGM